MSFDSAAKGGFLTTSRLQGGCYAKERKPSDPRWERRQRP